MKCAEFENRLHQLLDNRECPSRDEQLARHAAGCSCCGQMLAGWSLVQDALEVRESPLSDQLGPAPDFAQLVLARLAAEEADEAAAASVGRPAAGWSMTAIVSLLAVVAAAALVSLIPALPAMLQPPMVQKEATTDKDGVRSQGKLQETAIATVRVEDQAGLKQSVAANGVESPKPKRTMQFDGHGVSLSMPSLEYVPSIDSNKIPGVRPIRSSVTVAIGLLRSAIPGGQDEEPTKPQAYLGHPSLTVS